MNDINPIAIAAAICMSCTGYLIAHFFTNQQGIIGAIMGLAIASLLSILVST